MSRSGLGQRWLSGGGNAGTTLDSGGKYDPVTDSWIQTETLSAPAPRQLATSVWTGTEMLIWGGYNGFYLNDGGRHDPVSNTWVLISTTSAPEGRWAHTAIWAGNAMLVFPDFR